MAPLLGPAVALPLALAVRLGYAVSLAASTVLVMFPLRQAAMVGGGSFAVGERAAQGQGWRCSCRACQGEEQPTAGAELLRVRGQACLVPSVQIAKGGQAEASSCEPCLAARHPQLQHKETLATLSVPRTTHAMAVPPSVPRLPLQELVSPAAAHGSSPPPAPLFLGTTFVLLGLAYLVAVFVPSIWDVISFVGAVACTVMCFILPGVRN